MRVQDFRKYRLDLILPITLILISEMLIFSGRMQASMALNAITMTLLIMSAIYEQNRVYSALMLLPLFRLLNMAMPVFFNLTIYSYALVYAPMYIPIYMIIKGGVFGRSEAGLTMKGFWFYLPLAVSMGFAIGWGEYSILRVPVLIPDFSIKSILVLSLTMILFVGVVEEFIFRSALQTVMEERLGAWAGLLVASIIFGFMHSGYHMPLEILYVSFAGGLFGLLFMLTKSLPIIALAHGITNVSLFVVSPAYPEKLVYLIAAPGLLFLLYASIFRLKAKKAEPKEVN
jgi:membrane protease YdiL (CAAX protease family)